MNNIQIFEAVSVVTFSDVKVSSGFMSKVLNAVAQAGINIDMISQTPPKSESFSFGFSFSDDDFSQLLSTIGRISFVHGITPLVNSGNVKLIVKNPEMSQHPGFAAEIFTAVHDLNAHVLLVTTGADEISMLVSPSDAQELYKKLLEK